MAAEVVETLLRSPKAYEVAKKALVAMEMHKVWPTPVNFELWLHFLADKNSPVGVAVAQVIASGEAFTDSLGESLAAQHLPKAMLNGEILEAGDALSKELDSVSRAIESARESNEAYGEQLATASKSLEGEDTGVMKAMVNTLTNATQRMLGENKHLETQLADTTAEMGRLKEHLEAVRRDAMTDGLTNLANRKAFDEALERAVAAAESQRDPLCVAVIDIDHFKSFNDTWGHQTGDQVLRYVASVIGRAGVAPRTAARYGGEEFAIILPGETARGALPLLEHMREEIATRVLKRRSTNEDLGAVTISVGVAELRADEGLTSLIERADGALYASKHGGRNRTSMAQPASPTEAAA
jgi:diguanylate cyclase